MLALSFALVFTMTVQSSLAGYTELGNFYEADDWKSGTWYNDWDNLDADSEFDYVIIKQGNDNANSVSNPGIFLWIWDPSSTVDYDGVLNSYDDFSHVTVVSHVPLPGAAWLLGAGLLGLLGFRMRKV